jgi:hypothetical protein
MTMKLSGQSLVNARDLLQDFEASSASSSEQRLSIRACNVVRSYERFVQEPLMSMEERGSIVTLLRISWMEKSEPRLEERRRKRLDILL